MAYFQYSRHKKILTDVHCNGVHSFYCNFACFVVKKDLCKEKYCLREKLNPLMCADSSTDTKTERKGIQNIHVSFVTYQVSHVMCRLSCMTCPLSLTPTADLHKVETGGTGGGGHFVTLRNFSGLNHDKSKG